MLSINVDVLDVLIISGRGKEGGGVPNGFII
jgi:hypothetical protein